MDIFPENTLTRFSTWLHRPIHLKGSWEVALVEICFPKTFYNITSRPTVYLPVRGGIRTAMVPEGFYVSGHALVAAINRQLKLLTADHANTTPPSLYYRASDNRVKVHAGEERGGEERIFPLFSAGLAATLGLADEQNAAGKETPGYGKNEVDLSSSLHTLFVECDVCAPTFCGDKYEPLLRTVRVPPGNYGENVCIPFHPVLYVPLSRHQFQSIGVYIRDEKGRPIQFQRGRVLVTLHFRPQS